MPDAAKTILCVDDDPFFGELYRAALEPHGYRVIHAQDPGEGYERCKKEKPDLILLDVMMPEKDGFRDGFDLLGRLRSEGPCMKTPIIMISGIGSPDDVRHGMDLGANDYLAKQDITPDALVRRIATLLAK
jgi:putative two-component system response regulator